MLPAYSTKSKCKYKKPLAEGKTLPIKPFKELSLFGKYMALMLLKSEVSSDQNCANAKHNRT